MPQVTIAQLVPVLQTAIGPLVLISAVGLLLLTMTNRLGRAIDRARLLSAQLPCAAPTARAAMEQQIAILWDRAHWLRAAITLAALNALGGAVLVVLLFLTALWHVETGWIITALFVFCMLCQAGSLVAFIHDINKSLAALGVELQSAGLGDPNRCDLPQGRE